MATLEITTMVGCPLNCTFCPQDQIRNAYGKVNEKYMSLDTFNMIMDRTPQHVRIDFSGMAEPWANPNATAMLQSALKRGKRVAIYTTLFGITVDDSVHMTTNIFPNFENQVDVICLHLPDDNMNMRGYKKSTEYRAVLANFLSMVVGGSFPIQKFQAMTMEKTGKVHKDLEDMLPKLGNWIGHSRAGSLNNDKEMLEVKNPPKNSFPLLCKSTPFYDHNVVLPNGDVLLCCMDYGTKHVIGNIIKYGYWSIFASQQLTRLRIENQKPGYSTCSICKACENVDEVLSVGRTWKECVSAPPSDAALLPSG